MRRSYKATVAMALCAALLAGYVRADDPQAAPQLDRLLAKAQGICPVSGTKLGDHGEPKKAKIGEMNLFLCCQGCFGKKIGRANWSKMLSHLASAQGVCPVMKRPLPKNPQSVVVDGRIVFVCCKPCIKKVQADPKKYLAAVNEQLAKNLAAQK